MAKVKNPLFSLQASGPLRDALRYSRARSVNIVKSHKSGGAVQGIQQRRQATLVSEAARIWRTIDGRGPETSYREYIAGVSAQNSFYWTDAILLEWTTEQLLVAE